MWASVIRAEHSDDRANGWQPKGDSRRLLFLVECMDKIYLEQDIGRHRRSLRGAIERLMGRYWDVSWDDGTLVASTGPSSLVELTSVVL